MCGRYALHASPEVIRLQFGLRSVPHLEPRDSIAPTETVLMVREDGAALARWGFAGKLFNARAETLATRAAFRDAYRKRRCLVPASGFYEWRQLTRRKQPYYIRPAQSALFAFAGLWERQGGHDACTIVTTDANEALRPIHERMPVIVAPADYARWLLAGDDSLLRPAPDEAIVLSAVERQGATGELFGD
jgi:putative SOS response-associated peptidase YedK